MPSRKSKKVPRSTLSQSLPDTAEASSTSPYDLPRSSAATPSLLGSTPSSYSTSSPLQSSTTPISSHSSAPPTRHSTTPHPSHSSTPVQRSPPLSTSPTSHTFPDLSSPRSLPVNPRPGPSTPSSSHSSSPRALRPARPKLARPSSGVYTSFPVPPETPAQEVEPGWWERMFGSREEDEEMGRRGRVEWREVGKGGREGRAESGERSVLLGVRREEEPLRVSRECLVAEIKCYAKHMLPPIFVFVVLVLGIALWVYRRAREEP